MNRRRRSKPMNIETVQRWVASAVLIHVGSVPAVTLAVYSIGVAADDYGKGVGLWIMSGVIGLLTVCGVLAIFRRSVLSYWLIPGILPTAITGFYVL
ncbi:MULTISPECIES: hypothetical protein [unclassified Kribbella]|uniref:hypothetical protein n=1 Tax=unclassified Kribbella TaxID=2644121 RepID=UPI003402D3F2